MGLEQILEKINEETDRELAEINSSIQKKVEAIMKEGEKKIAELGENMLQNAGEEVEERKRSELASARLDFRKKLLTEKQKLLDEAFQEAFDYVRNLDGDDYAELVKKLILEVAEPGEGKIIVSRKDRRIGSSLERDINKTLRGMGKSVSYRLSPEDVDIDGGFILRIGDVEINCSLSSLFKKKREELESEVSSILFRGGNGR